MEILISAILCGLVLLLLFLATSLLSKGKKTQDAPAPEAEPVSSNKATPPDLPTLEKEWEEKGKMALEMEKAKPKYAILFYIGKQKLYSPVFEPDLYVGGLGYFHVINSKSLAEGALRDFYHQKVFVDRDGWTYASSTVRKAKVVEFK